MARIIIIGGDGFCGWPTALHLSDAGHEITLIDDLSRRAIDAEIGAESLTPIAEIDARLAAWAEVSGRRMAFHRIDIAADYDGLRLVLDGVEPDAIVHFAEQRAAPYSMRSQRAKRYTVDNNVTGTHNLLVAIAELGIDPHVVHLGTMGVYGYDGDGLELPEGYLEVFLKAPDGRMIPREILYPVNPGSVYHMTKCMDQLAFQFYAKNDGLRVTDLHQGIVWGTQTAQTRRDPRLINRFDYDGDYGTVLNRFLMQAAMGHPLTVHGSGGQTRAFINIQDTVRCIEMAIDAPPEKGAGVRIRNQMTETHRVADLARLVARVTGAEIAHVDNPRKEAAENGLKVSNASFLDLGLAPITLADGLLDETLEISRKYADRVRMEAIPARSVWTRAQRPGEVKARRDVA